MDDQAALLARNVARAASAWLSAPVDVEVYRRLVAAVGEWDAYMSPRLAEDAAEELLDDLGADSPPLPVATDLDALSAALTKQFRERT